MNVFPIDRSIGCKSGESLLSTLFYFDLYLIIKIFYQFNIERILPKK